jgi:hypothetical protein
MNAFVRALVAVRVSSGVLCSCLSFCALAALRQWPDGLLYLSLCHLHRAYAYAGLQQ